MRGTTFLAESYKSQELFPDFWLVPYFQSFVSWQQRDGEAALEAIGRTVELTGGGFPYLACFAAAINFSFGHHREGERWLAKVEEMAISEYLPPTGLALVEIARQRTNAAIEMLERAKAEHDSPFAWIRALCERLDIIADDRIRQAMARLGLP